MPAFLLNNCCGCGANTTAPIDCCPGVAIATTLHANYSNFRLTADGTAGGNPICPTAISNNVPLVYTCGVNLGAQGGFKLWFSQNCLILTDSAGCSAGALTILYWPWFGCSFDAAGVHHWSIGYVDCQQCSHGGFPTCLAAHNAIMTNLCSGQETCCGLCTISNNPFSLNCSSSAFSCGYRGIPPILPNCGIPIKASLCGGTTDCEPDAFTIPSFTPGCCGIATDGQPSTICDCVITQ